MPTDLTPDALAEGREILVRMTPGEYSRHDTRTMYGVIAGPLPNRGFLVAQGACTRVCYANKTAVSSVNLDGIVWLRNHAGALLDAADREAERVGRKLFDLATRQRDEARKELVEVREKLESTEASHEDEEAAHAETLAMLERCRAELDRVRGELVECRKETLTWAAMVCTLEANERPRANAAIVLDAVASRISAGPPGDAS